MLTNDDVKYWGPIPEVLTYLKTLVPFGGSVLDIGPGHSPLPWATKAVDFVAPKNPACETIVHDFSELPLPFADKEFDFIYCRHVLEDMFNPFNIIREMSRVGKRGYIEIPSPIAEMGRGVDGGSPPFRGYHHHRFLGWVKDDALQLISKYPFIEYIKFEESAFDEALKAEGGRYWNTYFLWEGEIKFKHLQSPFDFDIPTQYGKVLADGCHQAKSFADLFFNELMKR